MKVINKESITVSTEFLFQELQSILTKLNISSNQQREIIEKFDKDLNNYKNKGTLEVAPQHLDVSTYKADLDKFWQNKQTFIQEYKDSHPSLSEDNIYSLLLNTAIVLKNREVIKNILGITHTENILTHVDKSNYSPISNALDSGDVEILDLIRTYIQNNSSKIIKVNAIDREDYDNILTVLKFPQFKDLDARSCYQDYLEPLYSEDSLVEIAGLVEQLSDH